jgi:hypothetical protein
MKNKTMYAMKAETAQKHLHNARNERVIHILGSLEGMS